MAERLQEIEIDRIRRGRYQPRMEFSEDSLDELADSIRENGVVQPIVVRPLGNGEYELLAGERRWRACMRIPLHRIPAVVRKVNDEEAARISIIENIQREDLSPIEEARGYHQLIDEFGMSQEEVAQVIGRSRSSISHALRLLSLDEDIQDAVHSGQISAGHAKVLLGVSPGVRRLLLRETLRRGLNVRQLESRARQWESAGESRRRENRPAPDPNLSYFEQKFSEFIGNPVQLRLASKVATHGQLIIPFATIEVLNGIMERMPSALGCECRIDIRKNGQGKMVIEFPDLDGLHRILEGMGFSLDV